MLGLRSFLPRENHSLRQQARHNLRQRVNRSFPRQAHRILHLKEQSNRRRPGPLDHLLAVGKPDRSFHQLYFKFSFLLQGEIF